MSAYPPTPELDKMKAVQEKSQAIGEFVSEFLAEKGVHLCTHQNAGNNGRPEYLWKSGIKHPNRPAEFDDLMMRNTAVRNPDYEQWAEGYVALNQPIEKLLAEFFGIDLKKMETERRAILEHLRKSK